MSPDSIYHITEACAWAEARRHGRYAPASLAREGFIHFSSRDQVVPTAHRFYRGQRDLVLLVVAPDALGDRLRYEAAVDGAGVFPHLYGALDVAAVVDVLPFPCRADGTFPSPFEA